MNWMLFVGFLWTCVSGQTIFQEKYQFQQEQCYKRTNATKMPSATYFVAAESYSIITAGNCLNQKVKGKKDSLPQMVTKDGAQLLYLSKYHIKKRFHLYTLQGECSIESGLEGSNFSAFNYTVTVSFQVRHLNPKTLCKKDGYDKNYCSKMGELSSDKHTSASADPQVNDLYIINITDTKTKCQRCCKRAKQSQRKLGSIDISDLNVTFEIKEGEELNPAQAAGFMRKMKDIVAFMNDSSAALTIGEGVTGILVRETEPIEEDGVFFAYSSPNDSISLIESKDSLDSFSRSFAVPKEAFDKAVSLNVTVPFAAVFRFINMAKDELKSTVLGNEVLAIEMGTIITNLTDRIMIHFRNVKYEGVPSCRSWNSEGSRPKWTDDGCLTINQGVNITCQCSHLTFFAILLVPLNETISSSDLNKLTIITQVGCGLSMFFLSIILFMHFLLRKNKANKATWILVHLVSAMFLLNFTFLINSFVANLKSSVGCKIMAALMHYFMLVTFTWFAVQAFHLCLQLYTGGKIGIRHYLLKVSIASWVLPSVVVIVLLIVGKYGEQVIYTNDTDENVAMCWITDGVVHYIVNIGYYVLVFLITFTTFIITLSWLFCLSRTKSADVQIGKSGKRFVIILGLCCMLGITWGCAFFAYGDLRIPAYYSFTVLNSFQGFFLFIYYYNTRLSGEIQEDIRGHSTLKNTSTTLTSLGDLVNPYSNMPAIK